MHECHWGHDQQIFDTFGILCYSRKCDQSAKRMSLCGVVNGCMSSCESLFMKLLVEALRMAAVTREYGNDIVSHCIWLFLGVMFYGKR